MRLSDYVAEFIAHHAPRVYGVCGAGAMHLNDAIANNPAIEVIATHHEQAATYAAEADARVNGAPAFVMVTAGPGGSNTLTGVACAFVDSIPLVIIAGQVTTQTMAEGRLRQLGMNELDMVAMMQPVTKLAVTVSDPAMVRYWLEKAYHIATEGRGGPVFLEFPLDVQAAQIDPASLMTFVPTEHPTLPSGNYVEREAAKCIALLKKSFRPVFLIGNGVRLAKSCRKMQRLANKVNIPIVTSWGAADIIPEHHCLIGHCGLFGDRASNFVMQNCDLLICIGTRMSAGQIGHSANLFAAQAKKVIVDIDHGEINKWGNTIDVPVIADASDFIDALLLNDGLGVSEHHTKWVFHCQNVRDAHPVMQPEYSEAREGINAYHFIDQLSPLLDDNAIIVTDVGFCFIPTFQSIKLKPGQRLIHSAGVSPMGWGMPAAVGAALSGRHKRHVVCLTGDGGAMMNIQELQTIVHHQLPITIFVFDNNGYATMKIAQNNHFHREVMSGPESGLEMPRFAKVAQAFGLSTMELRDHDALRDGVKTALMAGKIAPMLVTLFMTEGQVITPRLMARTENGKFLPTKFDDMWPFIPALTYSNIEEEVHVDSE